MSQAVFLTDKVNLTFADGLFHYFTVYDSLGENAAMKYISHLKQILKLVKGRWSERNHGALLLSVPLMK